jgi:hypothetical protein
MARIHSTQKGFEAIGVFLAVLVVAIIGFASYKVLTMNKTADNLPATSAAATEPEKIQSQSDLADTSKVLDSASSELDGNLNDGSLDADLNALL